MIIMSNDLSTLGAVIRQERLKRGLSQESLAALCGLSRAYVGEIERGEVNVSFLTLVALAEGLGVTLAAVMESYGRQRR